MENNSPKKANSSSWLVLTGLALIMVAIVAIILFFLNGQTVITGEFEGRKISETLTCESNNVAYPIFAFNEADDKLLKINTVFEDESLSAISLMYKLDYSDQDTLSFSEARNRAAMNESFRNDGMKPDSLDAKYGIMSDGMQFSIYAKSSDINEKTLKYFMLDSTIKTNQLSKEKLAKLYSNAELNCMIKTNKIKKEVDEE